MSKIHVNHKILILFIVSLLLSLWSLISFPSQPEVDYSDYAVTTELFDYNVCQEFSPYKTKEIPFEIIFLENSYVAFKEAIAFKESQGMYSAVNTLGYLGKYQFGVTTLNLLGIKDPQNFLNNPALQENAFLANSKRNKWVLRSYIKCFVGQKIDGIRITESGILASAHLAGPGNVKRYLRSYGSLDSKDAYGTNIPSYMRKFSGYDTSFVIANQKSKVNLFE